MPHPSPARRLPDIYVLNDDFDRLAHLLDCLRVQSPGARLLSQELDRATIVGPDEIGEPFVRLNSRVRYEDMDTRVRRDVQVVARQACVEDSTVSIFSPIGAALLGLRPGQAFHWSADDGRARSLRVLSLLDPGERSPASTSA